MANVLADKKATAFASHYRRLLVHQFAPNVHQSATAQEENMPQVLVGKELAAYDFQQGVE